MHLKIGRKKNLENVTETAKQPKRPPDWHWSLIQTQSPLHQLSPFPCNWYLHKSIDQEIQRYGMICFAITHLRAGSTGFGLVIATTHQRADTWMLERLLELSNK